jgi:hypothetical protein
MDNKVKGSIGSQIGNIKERTLKIKIKGKNVVGIRRLMMV